MSLAGIRNPAQEQTSIKFAAHATSSATSSAMCNRSLERVVPMTAKTSGDSTPGV